MHIHALARLGENDLIRAPRGRHGRTDHLESLAGARPTSRLEVDLPDLEERIVRVVARGEVLRQAAEGHRGFAGLALREIEVALQQ